MALSATMIYDGKRCKIVRVTETAVNGAAANLAQPFADIAGTSFQGGAVPTEISVVQTEAAVDETVSVAVTAATADGFTFRRLTAGAGATQARWYVTLRVPRGIAA